MGDKKRVLFVGEASFLNTGFSNYYRELLPRLAATNKYEIAEFGSYARQDDPRVYEFIQNRWKFYGNMPASKEEQDVYNRITSPRTNGQNTNQFGEYKFSAVLVDFQPDFVIDIRDWWMLEYQERSPFRKYFKWIIQPTVDSAPQKEEWIATYESANLVLSYSDFGINTLKRSSPKIKVWKTPMRPGINLDIFKPMDRIEAKKFWLGCKDDVRVILVTMRNQSRKLFPDLIDAFGRMKNKYRGEKVVDKAVLLLHSSWPDNMYSYDYPRHIARLQTNYYGLEPNTAYKGIKNDVMQTFMCHKCNHIFAGWAMNLYNRPIENRGMGHKIYVPCQKCGENTATTPDTAHGFTREQLAWLYNCCDIYAQVSIAEGEGMPPNEAKACGKPVLVMDHSSMAEKGKFCDHYIHLKNKRAEYTAHYGGEVINVDRHYYEPETSQRRCLPDIDDLADKLYDLLVNDERRDRMGRDAREATESNYDHDKLAQEWEYILDNVKPIDRSTTWEKPHHVIARETVEVPVELYQPSKEEAFVSFLYLNILKYQHVDEQGMRHWVDLLRKGTRTHQQVYDYFVNVANQERVGDDHVNQMMSQKQKGERTPGDKVVGKVL